MHHSTHSSWLWICWALCCVWVPEIISASLCSAFIGRLQWVAQHNTCIPSAAQRAQGRWRGGLCAGPPTMMFLFSLWYRLLYCTNKISSIAECQLTNFSGNKLDAYFKKHFRSQLQLWYVYFRRIYSSGEAINALSWQSESALKLIQIICISVCILTFCTIDIYCQSEEIPRSLYKFLKSNKILSLEGEVFWSLFFIFCYLLHIYVILMFRKANDDMIWSAQYYKPGRWN